MDLIERQAAIDAINRYGSVWMEYTKDMSVDEIAERALKASKQSMVKILHDLPSAQPEQKTGRWKKRYISDFRFQYYCSVCGMIQVYGEPNYCPNCGAKMDMERE